MPRLMLLLSAIVVLFAGACSINSPLDADDDAIESVAIPPEAIPGGPYSGEPDEELTLTGGGRDIDGYLIAYEWDFNDDGVFDWGSARTGQTATTYRNEGTYTARLRVTDDAGNSATGTAVVTIRPPASD